MQKPECQKSLRAKLDILLVVANLGAVFGTRYDALSWHEAMSNAALAAPLGFMKAGQKLDADKQANVNSRVSKILNGQRPVAWGQLVALARHTGLDRFLGSDKEAALCLCDEVPVHDFKKRLFETGWAHPDFAERALFGTRHLLLTAFARFPMRRDGLLVGPDAVVRGASLGMTRGARLPQPEDLDDDLPVFPLGAWLKARLDTRDPAAPRALVLIEVRPAPAKPHGYAVSCLAPSPLAPERMLPLAAATVLPTQAFNGIDSYILDQTLGRHDWLALLTSSPLPLPWAVPDETLHEPTAAQLADLLGALEAAVKRGEAVEVRRFPFLAGLRGAA